MSSRLSIRLPTGPLPWNFPSSTFRYFIIIHSDLQPAHFNLINLTLILLTWRIWWACNNVSKWQMGFNLAFKELIRNSFKTFPEFAGIIYRNCYYKSINVHWHPSSPEGFGQKEMQWKMENQQLIFLHNAPAHRSVLVNDFLVKNSVTTLEHHSYSRVLATAAFTRSLDWNEQWRDEDLMTLLTSLRIRRRSWKGFHKMASRNVSNIFTVAGTSV
jgi:hypothetical protein